MNLKLPKVGEIDLSRVECPQCDSDELHILTAKIFLRDHAAEATGNRFTITAERPESDRPAIRGSVIRVVFGCEGCRRASQLQLTFHKGTVDVVTVDRGHWDWQERSGEDDPRELWRS